MLNNLVGVYTRNNKNNKAISIMDVILSSCA